MDRLFFRSPVSRVATACVLSSLAGCVANPIQVPTVWDKLGIPQATALFRDSTINRSGNFPNLEKKPPLLKLADPANLAPEKPEMIKAAAKIKQDQDLKKQKIKAIKFLAEVNCGCYNKDDAVAKAFLAALEDCDPDVRKAAIEGLCVAAGNCTKCRTGCETTCCTEDILKKLQDIATGVDANGCCKEPIKEIRTAAAAAIRKCPCPPAKPIEEIPAPPPSEIEEITAPEGKESSSGDSRTPKKESASTGQPSSIHGVSYRVQGASFVEGAEPVIVAKRGNKPTSESGPIANPDHLISARVVTTKPNLGEVLIELPDTYQLKLGWTMVLVDGNGTNQLAKVSDSSGRRILLAVDGELKASVRVGGEVKVGLVQN
jgi:hypothetical protein